MRQEVVEDGERVAGYGPSGERKLMWVLAPLGSGGAILVVPRAWWIVMTDCVACLIWLSRE